MSSAPDSRAAWPIASAMASCVLGHRVEDAVGFHVLEIGAGGAAELADGAGLVAHVVPQLGGGDVHDPPAEPHEIRQRGVGAQRDPCFRASATVFRMTCGSPPWKPHAMLAEVMYGMMASSAPRVQRP